MLTNFLVFIACLLKLCKFTWVSGVSGVWPLFWCVPFSQCSSCYKSTCKKKTSVHFLLYAEQIVTDSFHKGDGTVTFT